MKNRGKGQNVLFSCKMSKEPYSSSLALALITKYAHASNFVKIKKHVHTEQKKAQIMKLRI